MLNFIRYTETRFIWLFGFCVPIDKEWHRISWRQIGSTMHGGYKINQQTHKQIESRNIEQETSIPNIPCYATDIRLTRNNYNQNKNERIANQAYVPFARAREHISLYFHFSQSKCLLAFISLFLTIFHFTLFFRLLLKRNAFFLAHIKSGSFPISLNFWILSFIATHFVSVR